MGPLAIIIGVLIFVASLAAMYFITKRAIIKALEEEPGPKDWTKDELNLEPVKNVRIADGGDDPFIRECFFAVGLIGRHSFDRLNPKRPRPHIGVVLVCKAIDNPGSVMCAYDVLDIPGGMIIGDESEVAAEKIKENVFITIQMPVVDHLADDIQEKLNLYAKVPIKLHYTLALKGASIQRSIDTMLRWRSPVNEQDEDLSAYIAQFRS